MSKNTRVKKQNNKNIFFHVYDWMITKLDLKNTELLVFALIYSFTQNDKGIFNGSLRYLAGLTYASRTTIQRALKELVDKGYIVKTPRRKQSKVPLANYRYSKNKLTELGISNYIKNAPQQDMPFITIFSWMTKNIHLSGHKLTVFALMYSFTQNQKKFSGNYTYIAKRLNMSTKQAKRVIEYLRKCRFIKCTQEYNPKTRRMDYIALNCKQIEQMWDFPSENEVKERNFFCYNSSVPIQVYTTTDISENSAMKPITNTPRHFDALADESDALNLFIEKSDEQQKLFYLIQVAVMEEINKLLPGIIHAVLERILLSQNQFSRKQIINSL